MKLIQNRPYSEPQNAAHRLMQLARSVEPVQDGRIHIEKINWPFLSQDKGSVPEYSAGMKLCIKRGWLAMHESGTLVKLTQSGADLFA